MLSVYTVHDDGISFSHDRSDRFKVNPDVQKRGGYWKSPVDEHIIVWYQMETLPNFRKLYGRVYETLQ